MSGPKTQHIKVSPEVMIRLERERRRGMAIMQNRNRIKAVRNTGTSLMGLCSEIKSLSEIYGFMPNLNESEVRDEINTVLSSISRVMLSKASTDEEIKAARSTVNDAGEKIDGLERKLRGEKARIEELNRQKHAVLTELRSELSEVKKSVSDMLDRNLKTLKSTEKKIADFGIESADAFDGLHETVDRNTSLFKKLSEEADTPTDDDGKLRAFIRSFREILSSAESFDSACEEIRSRLVSSYLNGLSENISELLQKINDRKKEEQAKKQAEENAEAERKALITKQNGERLLKLKNTADLAFTELSSEENVPEKLRERTEVLREKWLNVLKEYESDGDYLRQFYAITVDPAIRKLREEIKDHNRLISAYNDRLLTYETLCQEQGIIPKSFAMTEDALVHMDAAIMELTDRALARDREIYIRNSIDEVMAEMGHSVIGRARELQTGITHNAIYRFEDNTAIGVTVDDCGDICMELGGLDTADREPDEKESVELEEDMKRFCDSYRLIREKLKERGIEIANGHELPPSAEYSQIINICDYDVDERTIEEIMTGTRRTAPKAEDRHLTIDK